MTTTGRRRGLTQWKNLLLIVAAVLVINLPPAQSLWRSHRLATAGVDVRATVTGHRTLGDDSFLSFTVPRDSPRTGDRSFSDTARVDRHTYDVATSSGQVSVRVLPGSTTNWRVTGQLGSRLGYYLAIGADVLLVLILWLYTRFRSRLRPVLVLVADGDLEPHEPGGEEEVLDRIGGQRYLVCGRVETVEDDGVVLAVGDRRVRVLLDGDRAGLDPDQTVRVTGTMIA